MPISEQLKEAIERYSQNLIAHAPIGELARRGQLTPRAMALYLESMRSLIHQSERNLRVAAERCEALGRYDVARWFWNKVEEEDGHDRWAMNDLATLPPAAVDGVRPAAAVASLLDLQARLIETEPLCFVAYVQWAEYFSVYVGETWLDVLSMSGFDRRQVTVVDKHLASDREHAAAGFREIDVLARDLEDPSQLLAAVEEAGRVFEMLCNEICTEARTAA